MVKGKESELPCYISSVKPNVGYLEADAGAVNFIKTILSVYKGILLPSSIRAFTRSSRAWKS
ncbi:hypothetical protein NUU61_001707 [Penicillium alfredii]|uniref:Beta-ketoacyl synthase C-terminal domain-containing protein n=1 Tax=Penicillium alfredii TaxID=1506179 RepID=A0A9W9FQT8_9EURO|nr:uncharacterized protein NUU61_001707 [Penicillium alfredii]KAJ5104360.1 hypothetical protein NUU61_001707 [Penicillium alfredii]